METYPLVISTVADYERIIEVVQQERIKVWNAVYNAGIPEKDKMQYIDELVMIDHYLKNLDKRKKEVARE